MPSPFTDCRWLTFALVGMLLAAGCTSEPAADETTAEANRVSGEVSLLVVDDPEMSAAIESLRAEWQARTGATLAVSQSTLEALLAAEVPPAVDAVIYPSAALGALAEREWIVPLPDDYAANRELAWRDTFELLQIAETQWGRVPRAVPLGSPVFTLFYRADLLTHLHKRPPRTWSEYHQLAEALGRREPLGDAAPPADALWYATAEPLAAGWAAPVFLARAAPYAKHRDNFSTLFHIDTMEPLIAGAGFERALGELVADAKLGPPNQLELDPAGVRAEFLAGHVALAICWPAHATAPQPPAPPPATGFAELPGSLDVRNSGLDVWERRQAGEDVRVPLLGVAGRLGSITRTSAQSAAAWQLLGWLSGQEWGTKVASASPATTLYRNSQIKAPAAWVGPQTDAEAAVEYATSVHDALSHQAWLFALRIPGREQYLAALDAAVRSAVGGEQTPADALAETAAEWRRITETLGTAAQRTAYRRSLGLDP